MSLKGLQCVKTSYWIHDTARNSCPKGQRGEAIRSRRFLQDVSIRDSSSISKDTITARTVEKKFLFSFSSTERQTVTIWRQWDKMTTGRGEGLMRYSDSWVHLDLILQVIQHIMSSNQIHDENEEQIKKKKRSWGRRKKMREKSCGKRAWARLRHSSGHSHETDHSDETSPPSLFSVFTPPFSLLLLLFLHDCLTSLLLLSNLCFTNVVDVNLAHTP